MTALGIALALPAASIGTTTGVDRGEQSLTGGLLTSSQQIGAAVGLALLATIAAARTTSDRFACCGIWVLLPGRHWDRPDRNGVGRHATQPQSVPVRTSTPMSGGGSDQD